jgi:hypothetical protein
MVERCPSLLQCRKTGRLEFFRIEHLDWDELYKNNEDMRQVENRLMHIGSLKLDNEFITQVKCMVSSTVGVGDELLVVCGCESGAVMTWVVASSIISELDGNVDPDCSDDLVLKTGANPHLLFPRDHRIVTSLAMCISAESGCAALCVGKTMGIVQLYITGRLDQGLFQAMKNGSKVEVPSDALIDSHSISGVAFLMGGSILVACSRLGNILTLKVPYNGKSPVAMRIKNPVHHSSGDRMQYAGFGAYGLAPSPGGTFLAVAKQAHEPDREFRVQQQIHQMITQGYLHIQSVIGPNAEVPNMLNALLQTVRSWATGGSSPGALWDAARTAALAETLASHEDMVGILGAIQNEAGISAGEAPGSWTLVDSGKQTYRYAAAMLHILRALQGDYDEVLKIDDLEMVSMKGNVSWIISSQSTMPTLSDAERLSGVLAIDFVLAGHESHTWIFPKDMLHESRKQYSLYGVEDPRNDVPARRISVELPQNLVARVNTSSMNRALVASVSDGENNEFEVSRCPATLLGNLDGGSWICSSCKRTFGAPPRPGHLFDEPTPIACTLCASTKICKDIRYFS